MSDPGDAALDRILAEQIYTGCAYKPFGEMTLEEVEARAQELRSAAGFGPTQRVASVASVWEGLAELTRRGLRGRRARSRGPVRSRCWR